MKLMWWEYEQLIDHINSRGDIWSPASREGMWLRTHSREDDTAVCGLVCTPPKQNGPFRQYDVRTISMAWEQVDCDIYLLALCSKWTDYGTRQRYREFLISEANIEPGKADIIAIGLCGVEQNGTPEVDVTPLPTNRELWPDINGPDLSYLLSERTLRSVGLVGGGWLSIRQSGGMLRVRLAISGDGRYGAGYTGLFEGFIRPVDGNVPLAAAFLFATTPDTHGRQVVVETGSLGFNGSEAADMAYVHHGNATRFNPELYATTDVLATGTTPTSNAVSGVGQEDGVPQPEPGTTV